MFIIGCGRSGTTVLGSILAQHSAVLFLNEPRRLWRAAYPFTDVWSENAPSRGGRLVLTAADTLPHRSRKLQQAFRAEMRRADRSVLIEKLPANSFRLPFLQTIFPEARYLHLQRDGREVARSIAKRVEEGPWFGINGYRWRQLEKTAHSQVVTSALPELCDGAFDRGLLEWRLNEEAIASFLPSLSPTAWVRVTYEQLIRDPGAKVGELLTFLGIEIDDNVLAYAVETLQRKTPTLERAELSAKELAIGGEPLRAALAADG